MIPPKYKFYLQINDGDKVEIKPHYKDLRKQLKKENGQEFFRASLEGKINLFGQDYEIIKNASIEDKLFFTVYKYNENKKEFNLYYKSVFNKSDCKLDDLRKKCELKLEVNDEYTDIMNSYENTYNLIELSPGTTEILLNKRPCMQIYVRGANVITNFNGGIYWEDETDMIDDDEQLRTKYYFNYEKTANEIYISGSSNPEVNGIYAGINADWRLYKAKDKYLRLSYEFAERMIVTNSKGFFEFDAYCLVIYSVDNTVLYKSENIYFDTVNYPYEDLGLKKILRGEGSNNVYLIESSVQLVNPNDPDDKCVVTTEFLYHIYARLLCDVDDIEGIPTYDLPLEDFASNTTNYKKCMPLSLEGGDNFVCTSYAIDEPTKYGKNDYGKYFTNKAIFDSSYRYEPYPFGKYAWANVSLWFIYPENFSYWEAHRTKKYKLKHSYSIAEVIKVLLKKIDPTIKHEASEEYSSFLYGNTTPLPGMDRFYMFIAPKSNLLKGEYDQPAQKAEISLKDIMDMLRDCYRCYWYIEDGKLKIEHIKFFMNGGSYYYTPQVQLDFTKLADQFNKKSLLYLQSETEYDKDNLASRYEFSWMDESTLLSGEGIYIDIASEYVQKDLKEEIMIKQFSSDVDYMLLKPSAFSNDGFALLCPALSNSNYELPITSSMLVNRDEGTFYEVNVQNIYASFIKLINFYLYDMPGNNIECNIRNMYADSIKTSMSHTIEFPITENGIDELQLIKTNIGNGRIGEITINMNTSHAKVKLLYEPK